MQSEVSPLYAKQTYLWFSIELLAQIHNANCYTADWLSCFFNIGRLGGFIFLMEFFWLDTILFEAFVRFERACYMAIWASFRISSRTFILFFSLLALYTICMLVSPKCRFPSWTFTLYSWVTCLTSHLISPLGCLAGISNVECLKPGSSSSIPNCCFLTILLISVHSSLTLPVTQAKSLELSLTPLSLSYPIPELSANAIDSTYKTCRVGSLLTLHGYHYNL